MSVPAPMGDTGRAGGGAVYVGLLRTRAGLCWRSRYVPALSAAAADTFLGGDDVQECARAAAAAPAPAAVVVLAEAAFVTESYDCCCAAETRYESVGEEKRFDSRAVFC